MPSTKLFSIIKTGYSAGSYGCSAEYFTAVIITENDQRAVLFRGLYGSEHRVADVLKQAGYTEFYMPAVYGKLPTKDGQRAVSEKEAIEEVKEHLNELNK